jgi:hypothetical protein
VPAGTNGQRWGDEFGRDRESDLGYGEIVMPEQTQRENKHSVKTNTA